MYITITPAITFIHTLPYTLIGLQLFPNNRCGPKIHILYSLFQRFKNKHATSCRKPSLSLLKLNSFQISWNRLRNPHVYLNSRKWVKNKMANRWSRRVKAGRRRIVMSIPISCGASLES
jgi:hypothetical protein